MLRAALKDWPLLVDLKAVIRRGDLSLKFDDFDRLPALCVRHGTPASGKVRKSFRTPRSGSWLLRPMWFVSLVYRRRKRVSLPVCRQCFVTYQLARVAFWMSLAAVAYGVAFADPLPSGGSQTAGNTPADVKGMVEVAVLLVASLWLWFRPVDGELHSTRLRLMNVSALVGEGRTRAGVGTEGFARSAPFPAPATNAQLHAATSPAALAEDKYGFYGPSS